MRLRVLFAAVAALLPAMAGAAPAEQALAGPWVELGADNQLSVRVVVSSGVTACPAVVADGSSVQATQRGAADGDFPVTTCAASAPAATKNLTVGGVAVAVLPATVNRIAVIGDTGCRIDGPALQECNDTEKWPFPTIAKDAAGHRPDLVIHVGDYYYRETACLAGNKGCAGSPHGDNWAAWQADLFAPAAPLLAAAPWIVVRGNHEDCRRGGKGWMRFLDPRPQYGDCDDPSPPYRLHLGGLDLMMFDSAVADDFKADPAKVAVFAAQFAKLLANAPAHSWLLTHRPVWALAQGALAGKTVNQTEQAAIKGHVPPGMDMVLSGHLHDFTSYEFGPARPSQLIVGVGGDTMLDLADVPPAGAEIDGLKTTKGFALEQFGFFIMERNGDGWNGTLYAVDDKTVLARCAIMGRALDCHN
ncbi:MAG: metallophosphoesterase [Alphaproteobacteria bacterium]|nr:metallophosphoesterase [Alphaproteobacteria bacterium]